MATDNCIHPEDMHDYLHLSNIAYKRAFEPLYDILVAQIAAADLERAKLRATSDFTSNSISK